MKTKPWLEMTTGRRVVLSVIVPAISGVSLSRINVRTRTGPLGDLPTGWYVTHVYDHWWAWVAFGLLTLAYLWWLWGSTTNRENDAA